MEIPQRAELLEFAQRRSSEVLILGVFLLVMTFPKDLVGTVQLISCLVLLVIGNPWYWTGDVFSASAGLALVAQLFAHLDLIRWPPDQEEAKAYWGLSKDLGVVCRQLFILILAKVYTILQFHAAAAKDACARARATRVLTAALTLDLGSLEGGRSEPELPAEQSEDLPEAWHDALRSHMDPVAEMKMLLLAAPQLGAVAIVLVATAEQTVWCLLPLTAVAAFYFSGDMIHPPTTPGRLPARAKLWMKVMSGGLFLALLCEVCVELWLPPGLGSPKPGPEMIADWPACQNYDPWQPDLSRDLKGRPCIPGSPACMTQRERCGRDFISWLCIEQGLSVPSFLILFALCWVLRAEQQWTAAPARSETEQAAQPERPQWRRTLDNVSDRVRQQVGSLASLGTTNLKLVILLICTLFTSASLLAAFILQPYFNVVQMGYLWFTLVSASSASNATLYYDPVKALVWPAQAIGTFNMIVIVALTVSQTPVFPCPHPMRLAEAGVESAIVHVSRFVSREQCRYLFHSGSLSDMASASDSWRLGALFQSLGMMKTGEDMSAQDLIHWVVFTACLVQRILLARWHEELRQHFEKRKQHLHFRARWYAEKLAASRQMQISMWDTKRQVLLNKLSRLTDHLNNLRSIWDGQRAAFTEEEEEANQSAARVENICLQGGVPEQLVRSLLEEFTRACTGGDERLLESLTPQQRLHAHAWVDKCVVDYLNRRYLRKLKMITFADETATKQQLLQDCRSEILSMMKEEDRPAEVELRSMSPSTQSQSSPRPQETNRPAESEATVDETPPIVEKRARFATVAATSFASDAPRDRDQVREEAGSGANVWDFPCLSGLLQACLDDMLFIREKDETLYEHRKDNSIAVLFCKALVSQSLLALVLSSALQFMSFRSITAAVSVSVVVLSLMSFPHVPWKVWVFLQWYNISVIFAKVIFQLSVFCEDGTLNYEGCPSMCGSDMPTTALLGLVKSQKSADPCSLARPGLSAVLWADCLASVVLLLVMCAARYGGRFSSTSEILSSLKDYERRNRRMSTFATMQPLDLPEEDEDDEQEDEESNGAASTHSVAADEMEVSRQPSNLERSWRKLASLTRWLKQSVVGAANVRRPAMDLYEIRLCLALTCLCMLMFGWSTMVENGRSFSASLRANQFGGNQVRVLVLFLIMIVMDRALYTWYRSDYICEDDGGHVRLRTSASWMWKGIMARVVQKVNVVVHVIAIHFLFIRQWSQKVVKRDMMHEEISIMNVSALSGFYVLYLTYLALSSLQLKYDVHVMKGGLRFCHSTDIGSMLVFKAYSGLPFLNELRVITDWTVTETSMNLFMWLKLEDAHHGIYRVRLDMEGRAMTEPAEARPMFEKIYMGVALLLVLLALLVGPLIFFSGLNTFMLVPSPVMSAVMEVNVRVEAVHGYRGLRLYEAVQNRISIDPDTTSFQKKLSEQDIPITLQDVSFPVDSDVFWERSSSMQALMATLIDPEKSPDAVVKVQIHFRFERNSTVTAVEGKSEVVADNATRALLARLLGDASDSDTPRAERAESFVIRDLFPNYVRLADGAVSDVDFLPDKEERQHIHNVMVLTYSPSTQQPHPHPPYWSVASNGTEGLAPRELTCKVASNHIASGSASSDKDSKLWSINGLYLGVVLTVGNLFRTIFKDSSKRMVYEEVSNTDLLMDLCDGIYLARVQGNLKAEWELYHELIRIYRSPELLAHVADQKGRRTQIMPSAPSLQSVSSVDSMPMTSRWQLVARQIRTGSSRDLE